MSDVLPFQSWYHHNVAMLSHIPDSTLSTEYICHSTILVMMTNVFVRASTSRLVDAQAPLHYSAACLFEGGNAPAGGPKFPKQLWMIATSKLQLFCGSHPVLLETYRWHHDNVAVLSDISDVFMRALGPIQEVLARRDLDSRPSTDRPTAVTSGDTPISVDVHSRDGLHVDGCVTAFFPSTFREIRRRRKLDEAFCGMRIKVAEG